MPLTAAFEVSQDVSLPERLTLTDASTGSDGTITARKIYLQLSDGTYLVPSNITTNYINWPLADDIIDLDIMDRDYAIFATVHWVDTNGAVVALATKHICSNLYAERFSYQLTKYQSSNNAIAKDYWVNMNKLRSHIEAAENAIEIGIDIYASQLALDRAKDMIDNPTIYF